MPSTFLKHVYLKRWILSCAVEQLHEEEEEGDRRGGGERCGDQEGEVVVDNKEGTDEFGSE
jgi:hypothetical protein